MDDDMSVSRHYKVKGSLYIEHYWKIKSIKVKKYDMEQRWA